jgi:hypothetical protein
MFKKYFFLLVISLSTIHLFAQDPLGNVPVITYWSLNDTIPYEVIKTNKNYKDGVITDSTGTKYNVTLVVVDSTEKNYTIRVFSDQTNSFFEEQGISKKELESISKPIDFQHIEYITDAEGAFLEFKNFDKMYDAYRLLIDKLMEKQSPKDKEFKAVLNQLGSKEYYQNKFYEEIRSLHKFHGMQYAIDSNLIYDVEFPNPFKPTEIFNVPNELSISMPEEWEGILRLENTMTLNGDIALGLMGGLFGVDILEKIKEQFKNTEISYEIYISYAIDPETGTVLSQYQEITGYRGDEIMLQKTTEMNTIFK